ncbi:MAG: CotH kinase family protein, partial [Planctomycetales bacterium]|nr:CotH kinase family protein [Planctomycetales bacterium]
MVARPKRRCLSTNLTMVTERLEDRRLLAVTIAPTEATEIELREATIGFELTEIGSSQPNVTLYYGDEDGGTSANAWDNVIAFGTLDVGAYSRPIAGLAPNTQHFVRAFALSFTDGPTWSDVGTFSTLPPQPAVIEVDALRNVSGNSVDISGRLVDDGGDSPVVRVYFDTTDAGDDPTNWSGSFDVGLVEAATPEFSAHVTGMLPGTSYYVRAAAVNSAGPNWLPSAQIQTAAIAPLRISEFMSANSSTLLTRVRTDVEARFERSEQAFDWIEIQNALPEPVDISGYHLTDDRDQPTKWTVPEGTVIPASGAFVVYASGFGFTDPQHDDNEMYHTNFQISRSGEYLGIADPNGNVLHEIDNFPEQDYDTSYGYFGDVLGTFRTPTPGEPNPPHAPAISDVSHVWEDDDPSKSWTVSARLTETLHPLDQINLTYRVMFDEPTIIPMKDDGAGVDVEANDGIFTATIPGGIAAPGQIVRYFVSATDTNGSLGRAPLFANPETTAEYYGTMIPNPSIDTQLPILHRFVEEPRRTDNTRGTRASVYYNGEFYDNIFLRSRGGTAQSWPKKAYKFEFNDDQHFQFRPDSHRVDEINVNTTYTDKSYMRARLTSELQNDSGTPSPETFHLRMHQNGEFFSVATFVEQPDRDFLRRHGMDTEGSYYKGGPGSTYVRATSSFEKKTRDYEDRTDIENFIRGLNVDESEVEPFLFDNVNLPAQINFMATNVITQNIDASDKNHYLYRDTNGTGEWHMLPWDLDLTFGPDALNTNVIIADQNTRGASNPTAVHPLLGGREFPLHVGKINVLLDQLVKNPRTKEMLLRRSRTMADEYLGTDYFQNRLDELVGLIGKDVIEDREKWGSQAHFGGRTLSLEDEVARIKDEYLARR